VPDEAGVKKFNKYFFLFTEKILFFVLKKLLTD